MKNLRRQYLSIAFFSIGWALLAQDTLAKGTFNQASIAQQVASKEPNISTQAVFEDTVLSREIAVGLFKEKTLTHHEGVSTFAYNNFEETNQIVVIQDSGDGKWNELPSPGAPALFSHPTLDVDSDGTLYVQYLTADDNSSLAPAFYRINVKKFDGQKWVSVGDLSASTFQTNGRSASLEVDRNDVPAIIFTNASETILRVASFDGSAWQLKGESVTAKEGIEGPKLGFDFLNIPHVVYFTPVNNQLSVQEFADDNWTTPDTYTSTDEIFDIGPLVFNSNNEMHISHTGIANDYTSSRLIVQKYTDSFSELFKIEINDPVYLFDLLISGALEISEDDDVYLAYTNGLQVASVLKYKGGKIQYLIEKDAILNNAPLIPFTLDDEGYPIVATAANKGQEFSVADIIIHRYDPEGNPKLCRFYSEEFRGHFYTASARECTAVRYNDDWNYEGIAYETMELSDSAATPVHRFWSDQFKHHFFTASAAEKDLVIANDPNWNYEGEVYGVYQTKQTDTSPVYRFYSPVFKGHFYTTSLQEKEQLETVDPNWNYEGIAWWVKS